MCGLFASKCKKTFFELAKVNQPRGSRTFSVSWIKDSELTTLIGFGEFHAEQEIPDGADYYIGHVQAPTSLSSLAHPAKFNENYLWHNGIVKPASIEEMQRKFNCPNEEWDTKLILMNVDNLSDINGTFACVGYINRQLKVFRNEISPLFHGPNLSFSSVKTQLTSSAVEPNKVFLIDPTKCTMSIESQFTTKENPYYFG